MIRKVELQEELHTVVDVSDENGRFIRVNATFPSGAVIEIRGEDQHNLYMRWNGQPPVPQRIGVPEFSIPKKKMPAALR